MRKFSKVICLLFRKFLKKIFKSFSYLVLIATAILGIVFLTINNTFVQNKVSELAIEIINQKFDTAVSIKKLEVTPLGKIRLNEISLLDDHKNLMMTVGRLSANISLYKLFLNPKHLSLGKILLYEPKVFIRTYKGENKTNLSKFLSKFISDKEANFDFSLKGGIQIEEGSLEVKDENLSKAKQSILSIYPLNILLHDFQFTADSIKGHLGNLSAQGTYSNKKIQISKLSAYLNFNEKSIQVKELTLKTPQSSIYSDLRFSFKSPKDLKYFTQRVKIYGHIKENSKLGSQDLGVFLDSWDSNAILNLRGEINGIIDDELKLSEIQIQSGKSNLYSKSLILSKITKAEKFSIAQRNSSFSSTYESAKEILPSSIHEKIPKFLESYGEFFYTGALEVGSNLIKVKGDFTGTQLGNLQLELELENYMNLPSYKGNISGDKFFFPLASTKKRGDFSGEVNFLGKGDAWENLKMSVKGNFHELNAYRYNFKEIKIEGDLIRKNFRGSLSINDSKLRAVAEGELGFSSKEIISQIKLNLNKADLKALRLSEEKREISLTDLVIDLKGKSLDALEGNISLAGGLYKTSEKEHAIPSSSISSQLMDEESLQINIISPEILTGDLKGKFVWSQLPTLLNYHVNKLLHEKDLMPITTNTHVNFDLKPKQKLLGFFLEDLKKVSEFSLKGNLEDKALVLNLEMEDLLAEKFAFKKVHIKASTQLEAEVKASLQEALLYGQEFQNLKFSTHTEGEFLLAFLEGNAKLGETNEAFSLNFYKLKEKEKLTIGIRTSYFFVNGHKWWINKENDTRNNFAEIYSKNHSYTIKKLELSSEEQKLVFSTSISGDGYKKIQGEFDRFNLKNLIPSNENINLEGLVNGRFSLENKGTILKPDIQLIAKGLKLNEVAVGDLRLASSFSERTKLYKLNLRLANKGKETLAVVGDINNYEKEKPQLSLQVDAKYLPIAFLEAFIGEHISDIKGELLGTVKINGDYNNPSYNGRLSLKGGSMKVNSLNAVYELENEPIINITTGRFRLDGLTFRDVQYHTKGTLNGQINAQGITQWGIDFLVDAKNLLVLKTSSVENKLFYGKVFAKGKARILLDQEQLKIDVQESSVVGNSSISIHPEQSPIEIDQEFIKYIRPKDKASKEDQEEIEQQKPLSRELFINIATHINPEAGVRLFLGENSIQLKGQGDILLKISPKKPLELTGKYEIDEGVCDLNFSAKQLPILKRKFKVKKASTITWSGKATNPQLDIIAFHKKSVSNLNQYIGGNSEQASTVAGLSIHIYEELSDFKEDFIISLPEVSSEAPKQLLAQNLRDKTEKISQFFHILLFGAFKIQNDKVNIYAANDILYDLASSKISDFLSSIYKPLKVNIQYDEKQKEDKKSRELRNYLDYKINKRIALKGSLELLMPFEAPQKIAAGLQFEADVSKKLDNSLKIIIFCRPDISTLGGGETIPPKGNDAIFSPQAYGTGLIYSTEFHEFKELLYKKSQKNPRNKKRVSQENK